MRIRNTIRSRYQTETGDIDIAGLKADVSIVEVASAVTKLRRSGEEHVGLCPLHSENTPSFHVNDAKGVFHCFGCGAGGDVVTLVQAVSGRSFVECCEWLVGSDWNTPPARMSSIEAARGKRQLAIGRAKIEWRGAGTIAGTPTERYLASRGIHGAVPGCIRHGVPPRFWDDAGRPCRRGHAMVTASQDRDGKVSGIQRLFLDRSGRKAAGGSSRLCLGQIRGGAVRLGPVRPRIMLATAVEDGLSLVHMFPGATVWAALGDANLAHVALPGEVREVVLCGDADEAGRAAVADAAITFENSGLKVETLLPRAGAKDFNEEWVRLHT